MNTQIFFPGATEIAGLWKQQDIKLVQEVGRRTPAMTEDSRETTFQSQRLSVALQGGNAVTNTPVIYPLFI